MTVPEVDQEIGQAGPCQPQCLHQCAHHQVGSAAGIIAVWTDSRQLVKVAEDVTVVEEEGEYYCVANVTYYHLV